MSKQNLLELSVQTSLNGVSEDIRNAVLKALKTPLEEYISDTQKSVELINSLVDYIAFLEGIFLENGQHFTQDDFKTPGLSSLLLTSNRCDEKEKREILEFFKNQYKVLYPRIFSGEGFETIFGFDNPASILIGAYESLYKLNTLKEYYSQVQIKHLDLGNPEIISFFNQNDREIIKIRLEVFAEICRILGIQNTPENAIKHLNSKLLSVFTFDQDEDFIFDAIKHGFNGLKEIDGFDFEGSFDIDLYNLRRGGNYNCLFECINYFGIKNAKDLSNKGIEEVLMCEEYSGKMIYFKRGTKLQIEKYEGWFGRKFSLEEAGNGTLKNIKQIYDGVENYKIDIQTVKLIFDYLDKEIIGIGVLDKSQLDNFIVFCRAFTGIEITHNNIRENTEVLKEIVGIDIDLEWITDKDLFELLQTLTGKSREISYSNVDTKETLYKPFFSKFNKFIGVNEKGEKYNENWNKKHFNANKEGIYWILRQEVSVNFINLFFNEFDDINDVINNQNFQFFYQNVGNERKKIIVNFIKIIKRYNIFEINLADINKEFIIFFNNKFKNEEKVSQDINFTQDFFDKKLSLKSFEDPLLKSLILDNSKVFGNLKTICELYNLPVKLSSFRMIFSNYVEKYGDIEGFFKFFPVHVLTETIKFIISTGPKDLTKENLVYILVSQYEFRLDVGMHHLNFVNEKEQLLQESFGGNSFSYFKKDENGNYIFNRDKKTLLKMIFDKDIELLELKSFINNFSGITLGKLVRYYRDSDIGFDDEYVNIPALGFLIQYALDKNDYYYLKHNIDIINKKIKDLNSIGTYYGYYFFDKNEVNEKLKQLLDKTGGFLTKTFVLKFVIEGCSEEELDKLIASYNETSQKLLSSEALTFDKIDENVTEAVFMAYRPTMFTLDQIKDYLNYQLQDNSGHLEKVKFKRGGYEESLHVSEKKLKSDKTINVDMIEKIETEILQSKSETKIFDIQKFDVQKFFTSSTDLDKLYSLLQQIYSLNFDYRIENYRQNIGGRNYDYVRLYALSNIFGIITKDSFEGEVSSCILSSVSLEMLKNIFEKLKKIKDLKFKKIFDENFKQEYLNDFDSLSKCFLDILFIQLKFIAGRIKKELDKELAKFGDEKGKGEKIRFSLCKNIASFFAMAGSELCTANDIERHNEERYIPVNIIDDKSKQIIGMLMMYVEKGRKYLIIRGLNFRNEMYQKYDTDSLTEAMMNFVKQFALENSYKKVYVPENCSQHLLSNSDVLRKKLQELSAKNKGKTYYEKNEKFYGGRDGVEGGFMASKLYLLLDL